MTRTDDYLPRSITPRRRRRSPDHWRKRFTGIAGRGPGIPATHIDDVPNTADKIEFFTRRQGGEALSIFHDPNTNEYYTHHVVPSKDWTYGPFQDEVTARNKLQTLKNE